MSLSGRGGRHSKVSFLDPNRETIKSLKVEEEEEDPWAALPKHFRNKKKTTYTRNHSDLKVSSRYVRFYLLFWKDLLTMRRRWIWTLIEILTPILSIAILTIVVTSWPHDTYRHSEYKGFSIRSRTHTFQSCSRFIFAPEIKIIELLMDEVASEFPGRYRFELHDSNEHFKSVDLCAAVVFSFENTTNLTSLDRFPKQINFTIRMPAIHKNYVSSGSAGGGFLSRGSEWDTDHIFPTTLITGPRNEKDETGGSPGYYHEGFLFLQNLVSEKIIHRTFISTYLNYTKWTTKTKALVFGESSYNQKMGNILLTLNRFPYPAKKDNDVVSLIHDILPITIVIAYLIPFVLMVYGCMVEKEMGVRYHLMSLGVSIEYHRLSWILRCLLIHVPVCGVITLILATNWGRDKTTGILTYTNPWVFFALLISYVFETISLCILLVSLFRRGKILRAFRNILALTATASCAFLWIVTYIPYYYVKSNYNKFLFWERMFCCLLGNTGLALGCHLISDGEARGEGVSWSNLFPDYLEFSVGWIITAASLVSIIYILLSSYFSKVFPDRGLTALPWYYPLTLWWWKKEAPPDAYARLPAHVLNSMSLEERFPGNFETDVNIKRRKELQLEKVTKYFGQDRALNKFNLNCYEGLVTAVIGDAGSGKSTLLSIVSGITHCSAGTIIVSRQDMLRNRRKATSFVGYCPGENILYPHLTVEETFHFFCSLKCISTKLIQWDEVKRFVKEAFLEEYRHSHTSELTQSARRILMVACAFIGGSRVVLLDEPTRHMNAAQKRMTWELIARQKKHRAVIVAMEVMNEGDTVIDQVVCMQHGEANCAGSLKFMEKKFGGGYRLQVTKVPNVFNIKTVRDHLSHRIGDHVSLASSSDSVAVFHLPSEKTELFPALFDDLENKKESLGIAEFGSSYATMDEVLNNVRRQAMEIDYDPENRKAIYQGVDEIKVIPGYGRLEGFGYYFKCFELLLYKNASYTLRRTKIFLITSAAPIVLTMLCLLIFLTHPFDKESFPLVLDLQPYKNPEVTIRCSDAVHDGLLLCDHLKSVLKTKFGARKIKILTNESIHDYVLSHFTEFSKDEVGPEIGIEILKSSNPVKVVEVVGSFNNQPLHLPPVAVSIIDNMLLDYMVSFLVDHFPQYLKDNLGVNETRLNFSTPTITVTNLPLPYTPADEVKFSGIFISPGFFLGVCITLGFSLFVATFVILEVQEKAFKHLQMLAGCNAWLFWCANYLWNFIHFSFVALLTSGVILAFPSSGFGWKEWPWLFLLLEAYGLSSIFCMGAWSLICGSLWGLAYSRTFLVLVLTGPLFMLFIIVMSDSTAHAPLSAIEGVHNFFLLFPNYALGIGIFYIVADAVHLDSCKGVDEWRIKGACKRALATPRHPWNEFEREEEGKEALWSCCINRRENRLDLVAYGIGGNLGCLLFVLLVTFLIRLLKESNIYATLKRRATKHAMKHWEFHDSFEHEIYDYDVLSEIYRVMQANAVAKDLVIRNLSKHIPGMRAVDNLCVRVDRGQCFCLLGVAGAGKTAALRMLVGDRIPTSGDVTIDSLSLNKNYPSYLKKFGYCPSRSPFLKEMTGHEILRLIGTLRRIPGRVLDSLITNLALRLLFLHDLDNRVGRYNDNSLRKLSAAVAMIGEPSVVVLDEPTKSIDLISRDYLFTAIENLVEKGSIVILTSKSVAECEKVCTKMAIMVNGALRCFGSPDHLRDIFAEGFTIIVKFMLDPNKIYFTTKSDMYRIHETRKENAKEDKEVGTTRKYIDERKSDPYDKAKRSGDVAVDLAEDEDGHDINLLTTWEEDLVPFVTYFERNFPSAILVDKQPGFVHYHIRRGKAETGDLFDAMEQGKILISAPTIESYYIGQANLDQVFINFARGQKPYE